MNNNKWIKFEKLATAIRNAAQRGAAVKWNSRLAGQRFDAVLRVDYEGREYLLVVDCINDKSLVTSARVAAFASKTESAGAHVGILASLSECQQEAFELTGEKPVWLLTPEFIEDATEQTLTDIFSLALHVYGFRFVLPGDSGELAIPEEPEVLSFLMKETRVKGPGVDTTPESIARESHGEIARLATAKPQRYEVPLPKGTVITHPNFPAETRVTAFALTYRLIPVCELISTEGLDEDPYLAKMHRKEELAKRNSAADPSMIESGYDTVLEPGKYYYNPRLRFSYYCEKKKQNKATIILVESYQDGRLLQARGVISSSQFSQFVEVTEQSEIDRLSKLYEKFTLSDKNLEERFKVFLRDLEGAESIDDLTLTPEQQRANKADYFFERRTVIGELKTLYTDASPKVEAILEPYRETPEWPHFFGEQPLHKVLDRLPDKKRLTAKIIEAVTDSIEGVVEKANRQIRATKETFSLPKAGGLLIILNDVVDILSPDLVVRRVHRSLKKKYPNGELRFPHVSVVLIIGGAHYTQMTPTLKGIPMLIIPNAVPEAAGVEKFVGALNANWAVFEKQPLIHVETEDFPKLKFNTFSDDAKRAKGPRTRHEFWSAQYESNPYLRHLSKEDFMEVGRRAFEEVGAQMIKGAPKIPRAELEKRWIRWSHFLDEAKYRAFDLKEFREKAEAVGERLEELYEKYQAQNHE